ncbi:MAG: iron chaperone [Bacteroidota bacterium]
MQNVKAETIDEYIAAFPANVQKKLKEIRSAIRTSAPDAEEKISYAIPTFTLNGNLVHFAAFKNHVGFYPTPDGIEAFKKVLSQYEGGKGTVQFPLDKPLPIALIKKIVKHRVRQNRKSAKDKKK